MTEIVGAEVDHGPFFEEFCGTLVLENVPELFNPRRKMPERTSTLSSVPMCIIGRAGRVRKIWIFCQVRPVLHRARPRQANGTRAKTGIMITLHLSNSIRKSMQRCIRGS